MRGQRRLGFAHAEGLELRTDVISIEGVEGAIWCKTISFWRNVAHSTMSLTLLEGHIRIHHQHGASLNITLLSAMSSLTLTSCPLPSPRLDWDADHQSRNAWGQEETECGLTEKIVLAFAQSRYFARYPTISSPSPPGMIVPRVCGGAIVAQIVGMRLMGQVRIYSQNFQGPVLRRLHPKQCAGGSSGQCGKEYQIRISGLQLWYCF